MAKKASAGLSVADLEKMLEVRRSELDKLQARRDTLLLELNQVDAEISRIEGGRATRKATKAAPKSARKVVKRTVRKKAGRKKAGRKTARGRRPKNAKPLGDYILGALKASKNGLTIQQIGDEVQKQGYKTNSSNFKTVVYQFVYHSKKVSRDAKTGNYVVK